MGYGDILLSMFSDDYSFIGLITDIWNWYDVAIYGMLAPLVLLFSAFIAYQKAYNMLVAYPILVLFLWFVTQAAFESFATIAFFIITLLLTYGFYRLVKGE